VSGTGPDIEYDIFPTNTSISISGFAPATFTDHTFWEASGLGCARSGPGSRLPATFSLLIGLCAPVLADRRNPGSAYGTSASITSDHRLSKSPMFGQARRLRLMSVRRQPPCSSLKYPPE